MKRRTQSNRDCLPKNGVHQQKLIKSSFNWLCEKYWDLFATFVRYITDGDNFWMSPTTWAFVKNWGIYPNMYINIYTYINIYIYIYIYIYNYKYYVAHYVYTHTYI